MCSPAVGATRTRSTSLSSRYRKWNTGTFELFGLPPTGRPVTMTGQEIFRGEGGRLVEVWHQEDVPSMLNQLGLRPPPAIMRMAAKRSARRYRRHSRNPARV